MSPTPSTRTSPLRARLRRAFVRSESGATAIEYGLIAALIAVAILGSMAALSDGTNGMFDFISDRVVPALSQPD